MFPALSNIQTIRERQPYSLPISSQSLIADKLTVLRSTRLKRFYVVGRYRDIKQIILKDTSTTTIKRREVRTMRETLVS